MAHFPFMIDICGKNCLIAGGGKIALHKAEILTGFEVNLVVVSPIFEETFYRLEKEQKRLKLREREFFEKDLEGMDFVVAATGSRELNQHISDLCRRKGLLVNAVDQKEACSFYFPAIIRDHDMLVAVSSGGQSPAAVSHLKEKIASVIPEYYGEMAEKIGEYRQYILDKVPEAERRKEIFYQLLSYGESHEGRIPEELVKKVCCLNKNKKQERESGMKAGGKIRVGTRESKLAVEQTNLVIAALQRQFPGIAAEKVLIRTEGDKNLNKPLPEFGGKGVFITELERALLNGEIDLAVHSAKDMPAEIDEKLVIAGVLPREDARDVLVTKKKGVCKKGCKRPGDEGFVIGTGSPRRQLQIKELYPGAVCKGLRGNITTRLQKLRKGEYDGIILAAAGLQRLGLIGEEDLEYQFFSYEEMLPAGGQGIIAIEGRKEDAAAKMAQQISDAEAFEELEAERDILRKLNAGCHEAVGVFARHVGGDIQICTVCEKEGRLFRQFLK